MRVKWSEEEAELFKRMYPVRTAKQMAELFPRFTKQQMLTKAQNLGLKKGKEVADQSRRERDVESEDELWTDDEKRILIEHYPSKGGKYVHDLLNGKRSVITINRVANRLGVKRDQSNLMWEQTDVKLVEKNKRSIQVVYKGW